MNSTIITDLNHQKELSNFIGNDIKFELLYNSSRDGNSNKIIHEKIDNRGPTIALIRNK